MSVHDLMHRNREREIAEPPSTENLSETSFEEPVRRTPHTPVIQVQHSSAVRTPERLSLDQQEEPFTPLSKARRAESVLELFSPQN